jgi:hypothetical protein
MQLSADWYRCYIIIIIISNQSDDRSTASSKTIPPLNAIYSFLLQMRVSSPVSKDLAYLVSLFLERLSRKSDNVVLSPFAFHIAVQQPFKPLWSRLLLFELEPSRYWWRCFRHQFLASLFVWRLPLDLSSKGDPASSYATAGIALRVPGVLKPPDYDKVEPPTRRVASYSRGKILVCLSLKNKYLFFLPPTSSPPFPPQAKLLSRYSEASALRVFDWWFYETYKVVQIWPGQTVTCLHTVSPGHIWTTLYVI